MWSRRWLSTYRRHILHLSLKQTLHGEFLEDFGNHLAASTMSEFTRQESKNSLLWERQISYNFSVYPELQIFFKSKQDGNTCDKVFFEFLILIFSFMNLLYVQYCCSKIYKFLNILWHTDSKFTGLGLWVPHSADHLFMDKSYHATFLCSAQHPCYSAGVGSSGRQTFQFRGISRMDRQLWGLYCIDNLMVQLCSRNDNKLETVQERLSTDNLLMYKVHKYATFL